jgi:hypothetical protein
VPAPPSDPDATETIGGAAVPGGVAAVDEPAGIHSATSDDADGSHDAIPKNRASHVGIDARAAIRTCEPDTVAFTVVTAASPCA